jgi:cytochrome c553
MKNFVSLVMISLLVLSLAATSYAASSRKGKKIYNSLCRTCHSSEGESDKIAPSDKTMSQWQRFVEKNQHKANPEIIEKMSPKDQKNLIKFLQDYAADAETAETCG